ncbi:MAG: Magnesium chelatase [Acidobacteria bacterium]|nr:Magnesium chelatase [Acidobacteriota bacterium]
MKLGLILNVIGPSIGGVLMMGHRGTGKSTAVRALADLLPEISATRGCLFNCDPNDERFRCAECQRRQSADAKIERQRRAVPVVDLPLGATEDRVCGAIDIQRALTEGIKAFEPGLLARANRGFLYIDEVNLLEDHLVDLLLDVATTGRNKVERENISVEHPARFVLVGSGNPEEGELRPQLLDRFGLYVEVKTENDVEQRIAIVERRESFERNPEEFCALKETEQKQLRQKIARASRNFATVKVGRPLLRQIATLCSELQVDGHRGELTITRAARALAAFAGRKAVSEADVRRVAPMSLRHRLHRDALSESTVGARIEQTLDRVFSEPDLVRPHKGDGGNNSAGGRKGSRDQRTSAQGNFEPGGKNGADSENHSEASAPVEAQLPKPRSDHDLKKEVKAKPRLSRAKTGRTTYNSARGRYSRSILHRSAGARIAVDATLRTLIAAGYRHPDAEAEPHPIRNRLQAIPADALRFKQFASKRGTLFIFALDTSGSMALKRISQARGALLNLLKESYIDRDRVAIVGFRGTSAEILLPASRSMVRAKRVLDSLSIGGGTPLSAGLQSSLKVAQHAANHQDGDIVLLLFTDGGANVALQPSTAQAVGSRGRELRQELIAHEVSLLGARLRALRVQTMVVETQNDFASNRNTQELAKQLGARQLRISTRDQSANRPLMSDKLQFVADFRKKNFASTTTN